MYIYSINQEQNSNRTGKGFYIKENWMVNKHRKYAPPASNEENERNSKILHSPTNLQ